MVEAREVGGWHCRRHLIARDQITRLRLRVGRAWELEHVTLVDACLNVELPARRAEAVATARAWQPIVHQADEAAMCLIDMHRRRRLRHRLGHCTNAGG